MSVQPRSVVTACVEASERRARAWTLTAPDFFTDVETLRLRFATLLGSDDDNIAIVPAASYGIATAARNITMRPGQKILVLAGQFPSHYYSWARLAKERDAALCTVGSPTELDWTSAILESIATHKDAIAVAALPNHHWSTGAPVDLQVVCDELRSVGATVVLDVTQTLGACPFDLAAIRPDYLVAAGYKWLFCPYGVSFLYVADAHLDGVPLEENWANRAGSDDFAGLVDYCDDYQPGARRYDVGERANFAALLGAIAAIEQILDWQVERISDRLNQTNEKIVEIFGEHGFSIPGRDQRAPHFLGMTIPDSCEVSLVERLAAHNVFVSHDGN